MEGLQAYDMPNANHVWGKVLRKEGFKRVSVPDTCPDCYTVAQFCAEHPTGTYILSTGAHVLAAINGSYYDTWNSGDKAIDFYWFKEV